MLFLIGVAAVLLAGARYPGIGTLAVILKASTAYGHGAAGFSLLAIVGLLQGVASADGMEIW